MKTVVLCSSAAFYKHTNQLADMIDAMKGLKAIVPHNARQMRAKNDYNVEAVKTWYDNPEDFRHKTDFMRWHFDEVAKGDAVLVVNDEKRGVPGYIGPNVLLEMGLAFYLRKPIYVLNPINKDMPTYEEVMGMGAVFINGDLDKIK